MKSVLLNFQHNLEFTSSLLFSQHNRIIGIYKALRELQHIGWIAERLPRLVAIQASGCDPIVQAWQEGKSESQFKLNASMLNLRNRRLGVRFGGMAKIHVKIAHTARTF